MTDQSWTENLQASVVCPCDVVFGLGRTEAVGEPRHAVLRPGSAAHGADGLPAPGVLFLLADSLVGNACLRLVSANDVIVTNSLHIELFSRPFDGHTVVEGDSGPASRYHGGAASATIVRSGAIDVASLSGRFTVLPSTARAAGAIGDLTPPAAFDFDQFTGTVMDTLGARVLDQTREELRVTFRARPELANERLGLHGGIAALMGERACNQVLQSVAADGYEVRTVTMNAVFFRPVAADDGDLLCVTTVQHAGRQSLAAQAVLHTQAGKPAVVVDVMASGVAR